MSETPRFEGTGAESTEAVASQGIRGTLRYLQRQMPLSPMPQLLARVRAQGAHFFRSAEFEALSPSDKRDAFFGYAIGEVWPQTSAWMHEHPGAIATPDEMNKRLFVVSDSHLYNTFEAPTVHAFAQMRAYSMSMFKFFCEQWYTRLKESDPALVEQAVPLFGKVEKNEDFISKIDSGFVTASDITWGLLYSIRELYGEQEGRAMPRDEFRKVCAPAKAMAQLLATQRIDLFTEAFYPEVIGDWKTFQYRMRLNGLTLTRADGQYGVDFSPLVLRNVIQRHRSDLRNRPGIAGRARRRCPALFLGGEEKANIIDEYFDWAVSLTEKYAYGEGAKR